MESRPSVRRQAHEFTIERRRMFAQRHRDVALQRFPLSERMAITGDQPTTAVLDNRQRPEAVPFDLEEKVFVVERFST